MKTVRQALAMYAHSMYVAGSSQRISATIAVLLLVVDCETPRWA